MSQLDLRGNTPVTLCIILHHNKKDPIYKDFLKLLVDNGANFKKREGNRWTPMSIAVSYNDEEIIRMMYDFYLKSREERHERNHKKLGNYLLTMKDL